MKFIHLLFISFVIIHLYSCVEDINIKIDIGKDAVWAVPLINDKIRLQDLFSNEKDEKTSIISDDLGRLTIVHEGELFRDPANVVFQPLVGLLDFEFIDSTLSINFSQNTDNIIDSAVIAGDLMFFRYETTQKGPISITMSAHNFMRDGESIVHHFTHVGSPDGKPVTLDTAPISLKGSTYSKANNQLSFSYDARNAKGERIVLDKASFHFNFIDFEYMQGFFPKTVRPIKGNFIPINLYKNWLNGTIYIDNPALELNMENAFGFSVSTEVNTMHFTTKSGKNIELEGEIKDEIEFNYPNFNEKNQSKKTTLYFDKTNSNINELFKEPITAFNYDLNAVANKEDDPNFLGYFTNESFYALQIKVIIPLLVSINNLEIVDTFDININDELDHFDSIELKVILKNRFPIEITSQFYFLNNKDTVIDSIFYDGKKTLPAAKQGDNGSLIDVQEKIFFINLNKERIERLQDSKKITAKPILRTLLSGNEKIWIYDDYSLDIKIGAKFDLK